MVFNLAPAWNILSTRIHLLKLNTSGRAPLSLSTRAQTNRHSTKERKRALSVMFLLKAPVFLEAVQHQEYSHMEAWVEVLVSSGWMHAERQPNSHGMAN